eukprot:8794015-Pyramimonas_sp.AAC.1
MEGNSFSTCGSRVSTACVRFYSLQELHGWNAFPFQTVALALTLRAFVLNHVQELHGRRTVPFQNVALRLAPRTFAFRVCSDFKDSRG